MSVLAAEDATLPSIPSTSTCGNTQPGAQVPSGIPSHTLGLVVVLLTPWARKGTTWLSVEPVTGRHLRSQQSGPGGFGNAKTDWWPH
ncbi:hypothetical protein ACJZ2D_009869 [Fusarium nematophilum]